MKLQKVKDYLPVNKIRKSYVNAVLTQDLGRKLYFSGDIRVTNPVNYNIKKHRYLSCKRNSMCRIWLRNKVFYKLPGDNEGSFSLLIGNFLQYPALYNSNPETRIPEQ